jgi:hypothetical protein
MKNRLLNFGLIVTSLLGYLEWGSGQSEFLFQGEYEILQKLFTDPLSVAHPFVLLPLLGQVLLLITLFQKEPSKWLTYTAIVGLGSLLAMICFIGIISINWRIFLSTLPFVFAAGCRFWTDRVRINREITAPPEAET